jgi:starch synthase
MQQRVAILPWGNLIEHYLDPIGLDLHGFATGMSGGWLFGYADALRTQDIDAVIVCTSKAVRAPERLVNPSTGVVTIALPPPRGFERAAALVGDSDVRPAGGVRGFAQELAARASLDSNMLTLTLVDEKCTILLCQEYEHPRLAPAIRAARGAGAACFATFQGGVPSTSRGGRRLRRGAVIAADGLIVASSAEAKRVQLFYGPASERVLRAPNPISLELWYPENRQAARRAMGLPDAAFVVTCHVRIEWHRKGIDILLAAWRRLVLLHPARDLQLRLIGSGADDARLEAELAAEPMPSLHWVRGYSNDRAAMRCELSAADAYVLSSRHEGFPVAPLEAMACGVPVILSDAPGTADILPDGEASGGLRVPVSDVDALVTALECLLLDPGRRSRMSVAALARVRSYASLPAVGQLLADFMRRFTDAGSGDR